MLYHNMLDNDDVIGGQPTIHCANVVVYIYD